MYPARSCDRAIVKGQEFRLLNFIKMKLNPLGIQLLSS